MASKRSPELAVGNEPLRLGALFAALGSAGDRDLLKAILAGSVTGAALAFKLGWRRENVSKRARRLQLAGLIEARREGTWVRLLPTCTGVDDLAAWIGGLTPSGAVQPGGVEGPGDAQAWKRALKGDSSRQLLEAVALRGGRTQVGLARACGLSQPTASRALAALASSGLLDAARHGRELRYSLDLHGLRCVREWIDSARAVLQKGRITAEAQDLQAQQFELAEPAEAASGAGEVADARLGPSPADGDDAVGGLETVTAAPTAFPLRAGGERPATATAPRSAVADAPRVHAGAAPTSASPGSEGGGDADTRVAPASAPRPQSAAPLTRPLPLNFEPEDLRPGDRYLDMQGGLIKISGVVYGEVDYLHRPAGGDTFQPKRAARYQLASTLVAVVVG